MDWKVSRGTKNQSHSRKQLAPSSNLRKSLDGNCTDTFKRNSNAKWSRAISSICVCRRFNSVAGVKYALSNRVCTVHKFHGIPGYIQPSLRIHSRVKRWRSNTALKSIVRSATRSPPFPHWIPRFSSANAKSVASGAHRLFHKCRNRICVSDNGRNNVKSRMWSEEEVFIYFLSLVEVWFV